MSPFFFFNDTATTEIYTLSLHDALPIFQAPEVRFRVRGVRGGHGGPGDRCGQRVPGRRRRIERKTTRLHSRHHIISYALLCLKKKNTRPASCPAPRLPPPPSPAPRPCTR